MISPPGLEALCNSFAESGRRPLPKCLCNDFARLSGVSDVTFSFFSATDHFMLCASSAAAQTLDEWSFTFDEGPSVEAASNAASSVSDTADANKSQWPRLSAKAHEMGYRSLAGVPLKLGGRAFGMITLHDRNETITAERLSHAEFLAGEIAMLIVERFRRQPPSIDGRAGRDEFHQATGMVMGQMGIGAAAAVDLLRAYAWAHDRLLSDVAPDVLAHNLDFQDEPPVDA